MPRVEQAFWSRASARPSRLRARPRRRVGAATAAAARRGCASGGRRASTACFAHNVASSEIAHGLSQCLWLLNCEAELIAIALAANEGVWIRKLLLEIGFAVGLPAISRPAIGPKPAHFLEEDASMDEPDEFSDAPGYQMKPFPLFNDNLGATQTVNNPDTSWRTRHLDVKYFKVRDYIREQKLTVSHVSTNLNVADFFTKALAYPLFSKYRTYLGMQPG